MNHQSSLRSVEQTVYSVFVSMDTSDSDRCDALHICFGKVVRNDYTAAGTRVFVFAPAQHWQTFELFSPH